MLSRWRGESYSCIQLTRIAWEKVFSKVPLVPLSTLCHIPNAVIVASQDARKYATHKVDQVNQHFWTGWVRRDREGKNHIHLEARACANCTPLGIGIFSIGSATATMCFSTATFSVGPGKASISPVAPSKNGSQSSHHESPPRSQTQLCKAAMPSGVDTTSPKA